MERKYGLWRNQAGGYHIMYYCKGWSVEDSSHAGKNLELVVPNVDYIEAEAWAKLFSDNKYSSVEKHED